MVGAVLPFPCWLTKGRGRCRPQILRHPRLSLPTVETVCRPDSVRCFLVLASAARMVPSWWFRCHPWGCPHRSSRTVRFLCGVAQPLCRRHRATRLLMRIRVHSTTESRRHSRQVAIYSSSTEVCPWSLHPSVAHQALPVEQQVVRTKVVRAPWLAHHLFPSLKHLQRRVACSLSAR